VLVGRLATVTSKFTAGLPSGRSSQPRSLENGTSSWFRTMAPLPGATCSRFLSKTPAFETSPKAGLFETGVVFPALHSEDSVIAGLVGGGFVVRALLSVEAHGDARDPGASKIVLTEPSTVAPSWAARTRGRANSKEYARMG
jgi:hypothetical protein